MKNTPLFSSFSQSIRVRGLAVALFPVVILVFVIFLLLHLHSRLSEDQILTLHSKDVINRGLSIQRDMLKEHNFMRQYIMIEDPEYKREFAANHSRVVVSLAELQRQVGDSRHQSELVDQIRAAYKDYYELLDQVISFTDQRRMDEVKEIVRGLKPAKAYDALDELFSEFRGYEENLELGRQTSLTDLSNKIFYLLVTSLGVILCVCLFSIRLFDQKILSRIQHIISNINLFSEGKPFQPLLEGEDEIVQLDMALHTMGRKLTERTAENEMFIYSVSHDLRSPLVNLQGFCEELGYTTKEIRGLVGADELTDSAKLRVKQLIEKDLGEATYFIKNAVSRLSLIIDSLLKLSRAGRVNYQLQEVDLNQIVTRVIESLRESSSKKKIVVTKGELPVVVGDNSALDQLFGNLIDNAIKYSNPEKQGEIHIGVDHEKSSETSTVLYVRDNGLGISSEYFSKLFLAFQRFHTGQAAGEGIGLTMTKKIVERLSGSIWFDSKEGEGTTFYVQLPLKGSHDISFQLPPSL